VPEPRDRATIENVQNPAQDELYGESYQKAITEERLSEILGVALTHRYEATAKVMNVPQQHSNATEKLFKNEIATMKVENP
jgi:hypothetical protein